jgi:tRNA(Glu) U13 pseudouridine synthase TruD
LKEIIRARNERRRDLRGTLKDRAAVVEQYLAVHQPEPQPAEPEAERPPDSPRLKRYYNE